MAHGNSYGRTSSSGTIVRGINGETKLFLKKKTCPHTPVDITFVMTWRANLGVKKFLTNGGTVMVEKNKSKIKEHKKKTGSGIAIAV